MLDILFVGASVVAIGAGAQPVAAVQGNTEVAKPLDIQAQPLGSAIAELARQSNAQILISESTVRGINSRRLRGTYTVSEALRRLLRGSSLIWTTTGPNVYTIVPRVTASATDETGAIPDILVTGSRGWTLNTGIQRTRDDSQPFIVFDQEQIQRSGARDLEGFLRDQLSVNSTPTTSEQAGGGNVGRSQINLRGLGRRETLILVDGRKLPSVNRGSGDIEQPSITGIPISAIERIEVLASSASGIYGSGATGGVINIILRRGYRGLEVTGTYGDSFQGGGGERRIDLTGGLSLEGGRTSLTFSGSVRETSPLLVSDREDLLNDRRTSAFANNPSFFRSLPPLGATPNFQTRTFTNLQLKPQFGGTVLSSPFATIPNGYRGLALDGIAPILANVGKLNFDLGDTARRTGANAAILHASREYAGTLALRRDFTDWLQVYGEVAATYTATKVPLSLAPVSIDLAANAPNNPFTQAVRVVLPFPFSDTSAETVNQQYRGVLGAIVKLPGNWKAVLDASRSRNSYGSAATPAGFSAATLTGLSNGTQDILRDARDNPFTYNLINSRYGSYLAPGRTDLLTLSGRVAGPIPLTLPGGRPTVTLSAEQNRERVASVLNVFNDTTFSSINYSGPRSQRTRSVFGEINIPLVGGDSRLPLIQELTITAAVRRDWYRSIGSKSVRCYENFGMLASDALVDACPGSTPIIDGVANRANTNPTFSARWRPIPDVTLRSTYATGFIPPQLNQLVRENATVFTDARDPERGGEAIGVLTSFGVNAVPGFRGGNPDVKPETSKTWSAGVIVEPRFLPDLRLSADWTRITKRDNYYDPASIAVIGGIASRQAAFDEFLRRFPERFTRGPASGGFGVGPITAIDLSISNYSGSRSETIDFAGNYQHKLFGGTIEFDASATYTLKLAVRILPSQPEIDFTGVIDNSFFLGSGGSGSLRWKGAGGVRWSNATFGLRWQVRYFDGYFLNTTRTVVTDQGSARVASQAYNDVSFNYNFPDGFVVRGGVNNVLNKKPPLDATNASYPYSSYGNARLAYGYLSIGKSF